MNILVKEGGKDGVLVVAKPSNTVADLKTKLSLENVSFRLRQQHMGLSKTLEQCGVAEGDIITVHSHTATPPGYASRGEYLAAHRLGRGQTRKSVAHKNLHQATQAVVMQESALLGQKMEDVGQKVVEQVKESIVSETVPLRKDEQKLD